MVNNQLIVGESFMFVERFLSLTMFVVLVTVVLVSS